MASRPVDLLIAYRVIKILVTPFNKQPAYKMGIIDDKGKIIAHDYEKCESHKKCRMCKDIK